MAKVNDISAQERRVTELKKRLSQEEQHLKTMKTAKRLERQEKLREVLSPELIDALTPNHGRTSCDDEHLQNAESGRCNRCVLLMANKTGDFDAEIDIEVNVRIIRDDY